MEMPIGLDLQQLADHGEYVELINPYPDDRFSDFHKFSHICAIRLTHNRVTSTVMATPDNLNPR